MIAFLIKSAISLALLLAVYLLVLQREKMHAFNRFYLLFAVCFSFIVPFIQIEIQQEAPVFSDIQEFTENITEEPVFTDQPQQAAQAGNAMYFVLWAIYLAGAFFMLFRFAWNLSQLRSVVTGNTNKRYGKVSIVLLDKPVPPHSFLNYIFFSKEDYNNNRIEEELLQHELTHINQKHSLDIILIEVLRVVFWFNPIIYLYRKAMKLNHEFLADEAVIRVQNDVPSYQQLLLSKIFMNKASGLASPLNYSLTKKRLIMMSKNTSTLRACTIQFSMSLLLLALFTAFCIKATAQKSPVAQNTPGAAPANTKTKNQDSLRAAKERYYSRKPDRVIHFYEKGKAPIAKRWSEMTPEEKDKMFPPPTPPTRMTITQEQLDKWVNTKEYGLTLNGYFQKNNEVLRKYKAEDFAWYSIWKLPKGATDYGRFTYQLKLMTVKQFNTWRREVLDDVGAE